MCMGGRRRPIGRMSLCMDRTTRVSRRRCRSNLCIRNSHNRLLLGVDAAVIDLAHAFSRVDTGPRALRHRH